MQQHLKLTDLNDIMHRVYAIGFSKSEIAALAPLVIAAARDGDQISLTLIQRGAQKLAGCVLAVAKHLGLADGPCELVLMGGLFQAGDIFEQPLREAVLDQLPQCQFRRPELPAETGACLLALQMLGIAIDDAVVQALRRGA